MKSNSNNGKRSIIQTLRDNYTEKTTLADPPKVIVKQPSIGTDDPFSLLPSYPPATQAEMEQFNLYLDDVYNVASVEIHRISVTMPQGGLRFSCSVDARWLSQLLQIARHPNERLFMTIHAVKLPEDGYEDHADDPDDPGLDTDTE